MSSRAWTTPRVMPLRSRSLPTNLLTALRGLGTAPVRHALRWRESSHGSSGPGHRANPPRPSEIWPSRCFATFTLPRSIWRRAPDDPRSPTASSSFSTWCVLARVGGEPSSGAPVGGARAPGAAGKLGLAHRRRRRRSRSWCPPGSRGCSRNRAEPERVVTARGYPSSPPGRGRSRGGTRRRCEENVAWLIEDGRPRGLS